MRGHSMMNMKNFLIVSVCFAVTLTGTSFGWAEDAASPVPVTPQRLEVSTTPAPIDMRAEDADKLVSKVKGKMTPSKKRTGPKLSGGISRTIKVKAPEVINSSPDFKFRDATERSVPVTVSLPISERRTAVETYRQSLVNKK